MMIPKHARKNFEPDPTDDKQTAILKKYYLEKDKIDKEIAEKERQSEEYNDKQKEIDKNMKELSKMKGKTPIEQLEREYFINELLNK